MALKTIGRPGEELTFATKYIDNTLTAMGILQRLAGECQQCRDELPENVVWILNEWESFSEG